MSDFKPYEQQAEYRCILTQDELVMIQKVRDIEFGSVKAMISGGKITRLETAKSELTKDIASTKLEVAFETIIEGKPE